MSSGVKPTGRRRYESPRRREQAAGTRRAILQAAERLFEREGYAATTIAAIAAEAGVAPRTVYLAFETKSGVLRGLWNLRLRGERDEVPVAEQAWYRELLAEPDAERQVRLMARRSRDTKLRIGPVLAMIRAAAPLDADIAELWARIGRDFHALQRVVAQSLADKGALRPGLGVERATDLLWTINHPDVWQLLGAERGWSADEYEEWSAQTLVAQLLGRDS